jgi:hypothetical protein
MTAPNIRQYSKPRQPNRIFLNGSNRGADIRGTSGLMPNSSLNGLERGWKAHSISAMILAETKATTCCANALFRLTTNHVIGFFWHGINRRGNKTIPEVDLQIFDLMVWCRANCTGIVFLYQVNRKNPPL